MIETPNTVHGRLLESAHIAGYTFKRAWDELKWLLQDGRWETLGFRDGAAFTESIHGLFAEFKGTIEQRKEVANALSGIASQRAIAKVLGVGKDTVARDLEKRDGANAPSTGINTSEVKGDSPASGANAPPSAAFQRDVDPYKLARDQVNQEESRKERLANIAEIQSACG